jgi:serine protease AprX
MFCVVLRIQTYEKRSMRLLFLLLLMSVTVPVCALERVPCRVVFRDKGPELFEPGATLYDQTLKSYHPRAIERRSRIGLNPLLTQEDKPLFGPYVNDVLAVSDSLLSELVWLNAIIVGLDSAEQAEIADLPFVLSVTATSSLSYTQLLDIDCSPAAYGPSGQQLSVLQIQQLHDAGLFGQGARIGIIDNGFRWREMSTLRHAQVEREYDFIFRDSITANESGDVDVQDAHGSSIFSVVGGWSHDSVTGVAPFATYLLAKSEDMRYERRIEEELYVEAMHWLERNGADIASSSLGYLTFDSTDASTPYDLLDGKTTFAARAINLSARRGMLCVTAAGNYGRPRTLITPADADSAITVGAMAVGADTLWAYSSRGPTADGRQKPEITAQGMGVNCQTPNGTMVRSSGTSLATPMVAGQLALLRGLYPDVQLYELRNALYAHSMFPNQRDEAMGHGVANTLAAAKDLGPGIGRPSVVIVSPLTAMFIPVFCSNPTAVEAVVTNATTGQRQKITGSPIEGVWYFLQFPDEVFVGGDTIEVHITATDSTRGRVRSYPGDFATFRVARGNVDVPCAVRLPTTITSVAATSTMAEMAVIDQPVAAGADAVLLALGSADTQVFSTRLFTMDGREMDVTYQHEGNRLHVVPRLPLARGVYVIAVSHSSGMSSVPFAVN